MSFLRGIFAGLAIILLYVAYAFFARLYFGGLSQLGWVEGLAPVAFALGAWVCFIAADKVNKGSGSPPG